MSGVVFRLADGTETLVDEDVAVAMATAPLSSHSCGYVKHGSQGYLHRTIMRAPKGSQVDHINGDRRDNRRCNLRVCTQAQNLWNNGKKAHNKSGFKGVYFCGQTQRWRAEIRVNKRCIKLGRFDTPELAAAAYDSAARLHHGQFARLNFPSSQTGRGCGEPDDPTPVTLNGYERERGLIA